MVESGELFCGGFVAWVCLATVERRRRRVRMIIDEVVWWRGKVV